MGIIPGWDLGAPFASNAVRGRHWEYGRVAAPSAYGPGGARRLFLEDHDGVPAVLPNYDVAEPVADDDPDFPLTPPPFPHSNSVGGPALHLCAPLCRAAGAGDAELASTARDVEQEFAWTRKTSEAADAIEKERRRLAPEHQAAFSAATDALREARDRFVSSVEAIADHAKSSPEPRPRAEWKKRAARGVPESPSQRRLRERREEVHSKGALHMLTNAYVALREAWEALLNGDRAKFEAAYRRAFVPYTLSADRSLMSAAVVEIGYINGLSLDVLLERRLAPLLQEFASLDMRRVSLDFYAEEARAGRYPPDAGVQRMPGKGIPMPPDLRGLRARMDQAGSVAKKALVLYNAMSTKEREALGTREGQVKLALGLEKRLGYSKVTRGRIMGALYDGPARRFRSLRVPPSTLRRDLQRWRDSGLPS